MCLGHSVHTDRRQKQPENATNNSSGVIELPYCEGIQVYRSVAIFKLVSPPLETALLRQLLLCVRL